ncbi:hypothetical protein PN823_004486 [Enterobacter hormaechei]|nr:hypothetical protein [Enterobacter hormaechei]
MTYSIAFLSGKGGITKTSMARGTAIHFRRAEWEVGGLDLDVAQASFRRWNERRQQYGNTPSLDVISGSVNDIDRLKASGLYHLLIVDGAAYGSLETEQVAKMVDLIVVGCRFSLDDMESAVETMNGLVAKGVPLERFCVVFSGVPEQRRPVNYVNALEYMNQTPYHVATGFIEQMNCITDAQNIGLAMNEVRFPSVRKKLDQVFGSIEEYLDKITSK